MASCVYLCNSGAGEDEILKHQQGKFYTTRCSYILDGFEELFVSKDIKRLVEPFAGEGHLVHWLQSIEILKDISIEAYDLYTPSKDDESYVKIIQRDTLKNPPTYENSWIITNPPFLARNKSSNKELFNLYETNDLYKCFIWSILKQKKCEGGILIIPSGFFLSSREIDIRCRDEFMMNYKILKVKYFEEQVFDDTPTTIVAFSFIKSSDRLTEQVVEWTTMPSGRTQPFPMLKENGWIIGGHIYSVPIPDDIYIRRYVSGQPLRDNEYETFMTLNALDTGKCDGRISLNYRKDYRYEGIHSSRTYATLRITGRKLTEEEQILICKEWNHFIESKRDETWSLFLPQYRESKEYARKRIPFDLAYRIVLYIIHIYL
jgi:hypothetical protein